jgi:hypothetical protein
MAWALAMVAVGANAAAPGSMAEMTNSKSFIASRLTLIHGCHYSCECGPTKDFGCEQFKHRHLHMLCLPVRCDREADCGLEPPKGACDLSVEPPQR